MTVRHVFQYTVVILLTLFAAYVLLLSQSILIDLLVAILIASAIRPLVARLIDWHVPQGAAILLVYLVIGIVVFTVMILVFPPVIHQVSYYLENEDRLALQIIRTQQHIEQFIRSAGGGEVSLAESNEIVQGVRDVTGQVRGAAPNMVDDVGQTLGEIVLIVVLGAYWLTSRYKAINFITELFPAKQRIKVQNIMDEIEFTLGGYVRSVVKIGIIIGAINFAILVALGVPNAPLIGVIIGVATTIPMIGGFLGGLIAVLLTFVQSTDDSLTVAVVAFLVQLLESYVISPRFTSRAVRLDPLLVITYSMIGFAILGIMGAWIAVPLMSIVHILVNYTVINPHIENVRLFRIENGLILMNQPIEDLGEVVRENGEVILPERNLLPK